MIRLNLGAGDKPIDGWESVDRKNGQEAYPLAYPDNHADEIRASHLLEHFPRKDILNVVKDWVRVLKPGGTLKIAVPDAEIVFRQIVNSNDEKTRDHFLRVVTGGQLDDNDFHYMQYDDSTLRRVMRACGLRVIRNWKSELPDDCAALPFSLNLQGYKPAQVATPRMAGVMTVPALQHSDTVSAIINLITTRGIPYRQMWGVFWDQCLERGFEAIIADNKYDWIVTFDYDSIFDNSTFDDMLMLMEKYPEYDAICPVQCMRESAMPLFKLDGKNTATVAELDADLTPCLTGHFGMTFFRVEAIKRMAKPWFVSKPDADGRWGDGKMDADIYFWHNWKAAGNKLGIATHTPIGHMQRVVTWPDINLRPVHQYINDYRKYGTPEEVRS